MSTSIVTTPGAGRFRVGVAGFLHESNSFAAVRTPYEAFATTSLTRGEALRARWSGASHELGGMLAGAAESAVPLYATFAVPSGEIERDAFERIAAELLAEVQAALPLDGLLLALHGATVAEHAPDADGELLARLRALLGPDLPIVVTFDLHANISPRMVQLATALIGYRSNPHLDQRDRGVEAAQLMLRNLQGDVRPVMHAEHPPMLLANSCQHTSAMPSRALYEDLAAVLARPGILTASIAMGFPHADVEEVGPTFLAVSDGDPALARDAAQWMSQRAWDRRAEFVSNLPPPTDAVRQAAQGRAPVAILDTGDNVGGGSAADSVVLLEEVLRQQIPNALIVLYAPAAVEQCVQSGVRQDVTVSVNGLTLTGRVRTLSDGLFHETQVRHGGWTHSDQGVTAVVETAEQHTIVLTSRRMAPFSLEQLISLGVHPERKRILIVKGVVAPRAAYEPIAGEFILAGTPGATADDPRLLPYRRPRRALYPLDLSAPSTAAQTPPA